VEKTALNKDVLLGLKTLKLAVQSVTQIQKIKLRLGILEVVMAHGGSVVILGLLNPKPH
jgi:hypothetical protein